MGVRSRHVGVLALMLVAVVSLAACDLTDTDGDGVADIFETQHGWDPANPDEDGDGRLDGAQDSDGDAFTDWMEEGLGSNAHAPRSPDNGIDSDSDALTDWAEGQVGTDPNTIDSDGDQWWDQEELLAGTDAHDALVHPRGIGDTPCDPAVESCPDLDLFVTGIVHEFRHDQCPVCQPPLEVSSDRVDLQYWHVEAELGPFHENPDGSGFWPIETATVTGRGFQADSAVWNDPCRTTFTGTSRPETRQATLTGPEVPFLALSATGHLSVDPFATWNTEVLTNVETVPSCGTHTSQSSWQPWLPPTGWCTLFAVPTDGVGFQDCSHDELIPNLPFGGTTKRNHVRATFRPPAAAPATT